MKKAALFLAIITLAAMFFGPTPVFSADGTWANTTSGGTWSDVANWAGGASFADGAGATADFSTLDITADNTVHLNTSITLGQIVFRDTDTSTAASWILDDNGSDLNTLTLTGGTSTITVNALGAGSTATISANILGTTLAKDGLGTLILGGTNAHTGDTTVSAGTLIVAADQALGTDAAGTAVTDGATLGIQGNTAYATEEDLTLSGSGVGGVGALNNISGTNSFAGDVTLAAASTIGSTAGTLTLGGTVANGGNLLTVAGAGNVTLADTVSGAGGLTKTGNGVLTLSGDNDYSGVTNINGGTVRITGDADGLGDASLTNTIGMNGGTLASTAGSYALGTTRDIALNGAGTIQVDAGGMTVDGDITGAGGLNKTGAGTLTLSGTNAYAGGTNISAGTVQISSASNLGDAAIVMSNNATLESTTGTYSLGTNRDITLNGTGGTLRVDDDALTVGVVDTLTVNGTIDGTGALTKTGTGTLALTATNSYSGGTNINGGTLQISAAGNLGNAAITMNGGTLESTSGTYSLGTSRDITLNGAGGTLQIDANRVTVDGDIDGSGALTKTGAGTLTLSGTNTYSGGTNINAGIVQISAAANLGNDVITMDGGTLQSTANSYSLGTSRDIVLNAGSGTVRVDGAANTLTVDGTVSGTGGLTTAGDGTLTLGGVNSYQGSTTIGAGSTLALDATGTIAASSGVVNNGTFTIASNKTIDSMTGAGATTLGGTLTIGDASGTSGVYSGAMSGNGGLTKAGTGTLTLSGNSSYTGTTTINQGTLVATGNAAALGAGALVMNGGTLNLANNTALAFGRNVTITDNVAINSDTVAAGAGVTHSLGTLSIGSDTLTVGLGATAASGTQGLTFGDVTLTGNATVNANDGAGASGGLLTLGAVSGAGRNLTIGGSADTAITGGITTTTGMLIKEGSGTLTLSGVSSYTGGTIVTEGTLAMGASGVLSSGGRLEVQGGTTFDLNGYSQSIGSLTGNGTVTNDGAAAATLTTGNDDTSTAFSGVLEDGTGVLALTKEGTGTFTLSGLNTYTGNTTINEGTLALGAAGVIGDQSAVSVASGASLDVDGRNETIGSLTGAGTVENTGGLATLRTGENDGTTTFSGVVQDDINLVKIGSGTLTLAGQNTYTGYTEINEGVLRINDTDNLGDGSADNSIVMSGGTLESTGNSYDLGANRDIALNANGTIQVDAGALTVSGQVTGANSLTKTGDGVLVLSGANSYSGVTNINDGTLQISAANNLGAATNTITLGSTAVLESTANTYDLGVNRSVTLNGSATIQSDAGSALTVSGAVATGSNTLTITGAGNTNLSGVVSGVDGVLIKTGTGTLTLSGNQANTYSGDTNANAGTILLNKNGVNAVAGDLLVAGGTVLWGQDEQVANGSTMTLNSGAINLSGQTETVDAFTNNGGDFTTGEGGHLIGTGNTITWNGGTNTIESDGIVEDATVLITGGINTVEGQGDGTTGGVLQINTGGTLTMSGATLTLESDDYDGGTLLLNGDVVTNASATDSLIANGAGKSQMGTVDLGGGTRTFTVANGTLLGAVNDLVVSAQIVDGEASAGLTKEGAGVLMLSGANTYTGDTTVNNGTLKLGASGVIADASDLVVGAIGMVDLNGYSEAVGTLSGSGTIKNNGGSATLTVGGNNNATPLTFSGIIQDAISLTKVGTGVLVLSGANTYTGATNVNGGTLRINASNNLGDATSAGNVISFNNGGILQSTGGTYDLGENRDITLNGAGTVQVDAGQVTVSGTVANNGNTLTIAGAGNTIISGAIGGSGGLTKTDAGVLTLSSTGNSYSGDTTINGGTLRLGAAEVIANDSDVSLGAGGTLDLNGNSETIASLGGAAGSFVTNSAAAAVVLTTGGPGADSTFSGVIQDGNGMLSLIKTGTGVMTLGGVNAYTGSTTISQGTIIIASNQALGTADGATTVVNGATLGIQGNTNYVAEETVTLSGTGVSNAGALNNISGTNSFAGDITLQSDTRIASTAGTLTLSGDLNNSGNDLTIAGAGGLIVSGAVSGNGDVTKTGTGALTLSGDNTSYAGQTTLSAGTLNINSNTALGSGNLVIQANTSIDNTSGSDAITLTNDNTQDWNGDFTFVGTHDLDLGDGAVTLSGDRTVTVNDGNLTVGGIISGAYTLIKSGSGALTLSGLNTYAGPTVLEAGTLNLGESLGTALFITGGGTTVNMADGKNFTDRVGATINGVGTVNFLGATVVGAMIGDIGANSLLAINFAGDTTLAADIAALTTTIESGSTVSVSGDRAVQGNLVLENAADAVLDLGDNGLTLSGTGAYTQNGNAKLQTTLSSLSSFGHMTTSGAATVGASGVVEVTNNMTGYVPDDYAFKLIDGTGGTISLANMANWIIPSKLFWNMTVTGGEDLTLTVNRYNSYDVLATNNNTKAVGEALEAAGRAGATGDMLTVLNALDDSNSAAEVQSALSTMTPPLDGSLAAVHTTMLNDFMSAPLERITRMAITQGSDYWETTGVSSGDEADDEVMWGRVLGNYQRQDNRGLSNGYNAKTYGMVIGGDQEIPGRPFRVGSAMGYSKGEATSEDNGARNVITSYQGSLYGSYQRDPSPVFLNSSLGFAYNTYESTRVIKGAGLNRIASADDYYGLQYTAILDGGYVINLKAFNLTPLVSLQYAHLKVSGYTETGADALNLIVKRQDYDFLQSGLGFRIDRTFISEIGQWTPQLRAKWMYDFMAEKQMTTASFAGGGPAFKTEGYDPERSALDVGARLTFVTKDNISIALDYDLLLKQDYYSHSGFAEFGLKW